MDKDNRILGPEDYLEPACPLCEEPYGVTPAAKPVPQQRIIEKMDEYMSRRDYAGAERHLVYWLEEAQLGKDLRGELMLRNELVGHYRKTGDKDKALAHGDRALELLKVLDFEKTLSAGTTFCLRRPGKCMKRNPEVIWRTGRSFWAVFTITWR